MPSKEYYKSESTNKPENVEFGRTYVYARKNIKQEERQDITMWVYDEIAYTHEEWKEREIEQLKADVLYMSLMTGVDLDV